VGAVQEADYVVVGAGTSGMSFADVVLSESDRTVAIVDRHAQPGGHWNDAYSFVRLHQPSAFYGVCSRELGSGRRDTEGTNAGLSELASGIEVLGYFDELMRRTFLPSGRVLYFPMSEYRADGTILSLLTGETTTISARRKVVDSGYLGSSVPSVHSPSFDVDARASLVPINDLTRVAHPYSGYAIIGGGKTGVDACLWLLEQGVEPSRIKWVRPRDSWFVNRTFVQPGTELLQAYACQLESAAQAETVDDLVARLERGGVLLRMDPGHWATMFRGATMSPGEVAELAQVTDVVRLGYVTRIDPDGMRLEGGDVPTGSDWLHVDCSAEGLRRRPPKPVFEEDRITVQYVVNLGMPAYSAALVARVELAIDDDAAKNDVCPPVPLTSHLVDFAQNLLTELECQEKRSAYPELQGWIDAARLNPAMWALRAVDPGDAATQATIGRMLANAGAARENLARLVSTAVGSQ